MSRLRVNAEIDPANDVDTFSFDVTAGGKVKIDIDHGAGDAQSVDTIITVFDGNGNFLIDNNDSGKLDPGSVDTRDSFLKIVSFENATYSVDVTSFPNFYDQSTNMFSGNGGSVGDYTIIIHS